jgi:hypothetical protein
MLFGAMAVLSPPVANYIKAEGFDTVEKLTDYIRPAAEPPMGKPPAGKAPAGKQAGGAPPFGGMPISIVVSGGANNNYWSYGGMAPRQSVLIDKWR